MCESDPGLVGLKRQFLQNGILGNFRVPYPAVLGEVTENPTSQAGQSENSLK
jgi:hypothetical protein